MEAAGGTIIKLPAQWYAGIPDRLILLPGARLYFVELKRKKKKARMNQSLWIQSLRKLGFQAGVVAGSERINRFITKHVTRTNT